MDQAGNAMPEKYDISSETMPAFSKDTTSKGTCCCLHPSSFKWSHQGHIIMGTEVSSIQAVTTLEIYCAPELSRWRCN